MSVHLRGDPEAVRAIRERDDGYYEVWMESDSNDEVPIVVSRLRLVSTGRGEIEQLIESTKKGGQ